MDERDLGSVLKKCLANGDKASWDLFIGLVQPIIAAGVLRSLARVTSAGRELADDLIQDTFLKLCTDDFRILRNFRSDDAAALHVYLKTIAASVVIDYFRSGATQKKGSGKVATSLDEIAPRLATNDPRFADVERRMLLEQVEKCLVPEEPRNRRIFWLYHRQGLTPRTISEMPGIGMATGGVETAIYRLTRMVRECLKRAGMLQSMIVPEGGRA